MELNEKAKSRAQQRFFGMVRAAQKGEMKNPSKEVSDVAGDISMKDAKKFAKTKHKGLPEKKEVKEDKLTEGDVPRNSMGKPIRIKDKIKAAKGFIPHKGKPTSEVKESVLDLVRKYGKKKKEKQPQKAMDAGARAKRKLARREYRSKVGATVPSELEDQKSWLDFTGHFHI